MDFRLLKTNIYKNMIFIKRGLIIVCMQYLSHDSFCFIQRRIKSLFQNVSLCHPNFKTLACHRNVLVERALAKHMN
jgi:hypothetical protein